MSYASEVLADGPSGYWKVDEASGTTATDASGNGRHGTYSGQYTLGQSSLVESDSSGKSFTVSDGAGAPGQLQVPVVTLGMTWTIECIINPIYGTGDSGEQCLFIARSGSNLQNAVWLVFSPSSQRITLYGSIPGGADCYTGVYVDGIVQDAVYHVAAVLDGSAARLYVNGTEVANDTSLNGTISITASTTDGGFAFGAPYSGSSPTAFGGGLDELAIYSGVALSAGRVAAHYGAFQAPTLATVTGVQAAGAAGTVTTSWFSAGVNPIVAVEADWLSDRALDEAIAGPSPEDIEAEFLACMLQVRSKATADSSGRYSLTYRPTINGREALAARIMEHDPAYTVTVPGTSPVYGHGSIEITWRIG